MFLMTRTFSIIIINIYDIFSKQVTSGVKWIKLEQLERLRSEDTPRRLMINEKPIPTVQASWETVRKLC